MAKARFVRVIFTDVQREYDLLLHLLTFGMDWAWRRRLFSRITYHKSLRVLDLACGTGLITFPLQRMVGVEGLVVGLDPSISMLQPAVKRKHSVRFPWNSCEQLANTCPFGTTCSIMKRLDWHCGILATRWQCLLKREERSPMQVGSFH